MDGETSTQNDDKKPRKGRPPKLESVVEEAVRECLEASKEEQKAVYDTAKETMVLTGPTFKDRLMAVRLAQDWVKIKHKIDESGEAGKFFNEEDQQ